MKFLALKRRLGGVGEIFLFSYLIIVISIAIVATLTGYPIVTALASSPALLMHGEWWRLITSAFVIDGPALPQLVAIAVLGSFAIYFGGSWTFWSTAITGHIVGTLLSYAGVAGLWLVDRASAVRFITDPDYGVSLIWCAALGAFCAAVWFGDRGSWSRPVKPWLVAMAVSIMVVVTLYSDKLEAVQHATAFVIGFAIVGATDKARILHKHHRRRGSQARLQRSS
jgi:hypothetical protein